MKNWLFLEGIIHWSFSYGLFTFTFKEINLGQWFSTHKNHLAKNYIILGLPVVKTLWVSTAGGMGTSPGQGTNKIQYATQQKGGGKKEHCSLLHF